MNNTLTKPKTDKYTVTYEVNGEPITLTLRDVQQYIVGTNANITEKDFVMFAAKCKQRKLNPFAGEAYCVKYGSEPAKVVVGKDVYLKIAIQHPQYNGMESGIIVQLSNGDIEEREGMFYMPDEMIVGGWARVYRKDKEHPRYISVAFNEVSQKTSGGQLNSNWRAKPATMVEKVAKVRALRESFVEELGGTYDIDEVSGDFQGENIPNAQSHMQEPPQAPPEYVDAPPPEGDDPLA